MSLLLLFPNSGPSGTTTPQAFAETAQMSEGISMALVYSQTISETWQRSESLSSAFVVGKVFTETWQAAETFSELFKSGIILAFGYLRRIFTKQH